jgi:16S rRNA processing protein RimM
LTLPSKDIGPYITIGAIVGAVGLQGDVRCLSMTDFPERFSRLCDVRIETKDGRGYPLRIRQTRLTPSFIFISFEGIVSVEDAALLKGSLIQIPEEERVTLPEGHYYRYEIIGLDVYLEDRTMLGRIESIIETGGNDVYVVKQGDREVLIPALKRVVKAVDLPKREMTICPIDGLLNL